MFFIYRRFIGQEIADSEVRKTDPMGSEHILSSSVNDIELNTRKIFDFFARRQNTARLSLEMRIGMFLHHEISAVSLKTNPFAVHVAIVFKLLI